MTTRAGRKRGADEKEEELVELPEEGSDDEESLVAFFLFIFYWISQSSVYKASNRSARLPALLMHQGISVSQVANAD